MEKELIHRERLETFAYRLGVAGILSTFLIPVFLPFALGSVSIILAVLSRGSDGKYSKKGKKALAAGIAAIVLNVLYIIYAAGTVAALLADPTGRQQVNDLLYRMYGMTLEEFLGQYGIPQ